MAAKGNLSTKSQAVSKKEFNVAKKRIDAHIKSVDADLRKIRLLDKKMAPDLEALKKTVEVEEIDRASLRKRLKEGAVRRAERDLQLAEEWFTLEEEAGQRCQKQPTPARCIWPILTLRWAQKFRRHALL